MKNALRSGLSLALSIVFLWLAFRKVDPAGLWQTLQTVRLPYVLAYVVTLAIIQICRAWRWGILVRPFAPLDWRAALADLQPGQHVDHDLAIAFGRICSTVSDERAHGCAVYQQHGSRGG